MSEQVDPVPAKDNESPSGLLLSVEPLREGTKLYATESAGSTDPSDDVMDSDDSKLSERDSDGNDPSPTDADGYTPDEEGAEPDHPPASEAPGGTGGRPRSE